MTEKLTSVKPGPFASVKGMNDILPPDSARWEWLEEKVRTLMARYAYRNIRTPIVEPTPLFVRTLGEVTDIVEKEMYSFEDRMNGDRLTLRPEATAGIVRAINEHNALYNGPLRVWLMGPMFRHERPQKGRSRQFNQLDVEALGHAGPERRRVEVAVAAARPVRARTQAVALDVHLVQAGLEHERAAVAAAQAGEGPEVLAVEREDVARAGVVRRDARQLVPDGVRVRADEHQRRLHREQRVQFLLHLDRRPAGRGERVLLDAEAAEHVGHHLVAAPGAGR